MFNFSKKLLFHKFNKSYEYLADIMKFGLNNNPVINNKIIND